MRFLAAAAFLIASSTMAGCLADAESDADMDVRPDGGGKADDALQRIVVTGFGPYQNFSVNESGEVAKLLATTQIPGAVVEFRILDVSPDAIDAFIVEMERVRPAVIISLGYESGTQLEERPQNVLSAGGNGLGAQWAGRAVVEGTPAELRTDLPTDVVDGALKSFGWRRSVKTERLDRDYVPTHDGYICNYLAYQLSVTFGEAPSTAAGFFHVNSRRVTDQLRAVLVAVAAHQRAQ
jgi:pyrrolidone-carboxylate peptidase